MQPLKITTKNRNGKKGRKNEKRIHKMRILQVRNHNGNMRICGAPHDNQRKRIHVLLPEMRPTISKKKAQVEAPQKTREVKENLLKNPAATQIPSFLDSATWNHWNYDR
jgi:hypothetical protein